MAHLIKRPDSELWWGSFTSADGKRVRRSTGTSDRTEALTILLAWEKTAKEGRRGVLTEAKVRRTMSDLLEQFTGAPLHFFTAADFFADWLKDKQGAKAGRTAMKYSQLVEGFLSFLGPRREVPLGGISPADLRHWQDSLKASGLSPATVNQSVKVLSVAFEQARRLGYIPTNPCLALSSLRDDDKGSREAFTMEQVQSLVKETAGTDWEGVCWVAFFSGLRLMDVAELRWGSVDTSNGEKWWLRVKTRKTGALVNVPVFGALRIWLEAQPRGIEKAPVFPSLAGKSGSGKSGLSMQFKRIMDRVGIRGKTLRKGTGAGRTTSTLSFHSFRHSYPTWLESHGVAEADRMKLTGHATKKAHQGYVHADPDRIWNTIASLPGVL